MLYIRYNPDTGKFYTKEGKELTGTVRKGYIRIGVDSKIYSAHRLAFTLMGEPEPEQIDHINGIKDDNRWCNLRACTQTQNQWNTSKRQTNTTGYKNVYYRKQRNKYLAKVSTNDGLKYLGSFDTAEEANEVATKARQQHHEEFYYNNDLPTTKR